MERLRVELPVQPIIAPGILGLPILEPFAEVLPIELAYTKAQKNWLDRAFGHNYYDIEKGQFFPITNQEINWHHITPAAFLIEHYGVDPNALNLKAGFLPIPLTRDQHNRCIHPDMQQAMRDYWKNPNAIKEAVKRHHELARQGKIFWNNKYDAVMVTASRKMIVNYMLLNPQDLYPSDKSWEKKNGRRQ